MKQFVIAIVLSVIMMGAGYFLHPSFFEFSVGSLRLPSNVRLSATDLITESPWIFMITMGLIPLFYWILLKLAPLKSIKEGIFSIVLIFLGAIGVWYLRIKFIGDELTQQSAVSGLRGFDSNYLPADQLKFSLFFGFGILIGALLAFVILSFIASPKEKKKVDF